MSEDRFIVITSINAPNEALESYARESARHEFKFVVIGDTKSPVDFALEGCDYYSIERQKGLDLSYVPLCPTCHYARKNIGYLLAARAGARIIRDTDDDNLPRADFWNAEKRRQLVPVVQGTGWLNVYRWFSGELIWPRGFPLDQVRVETPDFAALPVLEADCPIQQGLADENPDIDAIYRLLLPLPQSFRTDRRAALGANAWCPFNSQNTTWFRDAFPLLYLPAYCSFRMTDIWRSFVAQRIAWSNGWSVLFHEPTVWQERNAHNLMRDFEDEVPGYLHNTRIARELSALPIQAGIENIPSNMRLCYRRLCDLSLIDMKELPLLEAWLSDVGAI